MKIYDAAFYICILFILGIGIANSALNNAAQWGMGIVVAIFIGVIAAVKYQRIIYVLVGAALILGIAYDHWWIAKQTKTKIIFDTPIELAGVIRDVVENDERQLLIVGEVQIFVDRYPSYAYGNRIRARGNIQQPLEEQRDRLLKNGVRATMYRPQITVLERNAGNPIRQALFATKQSVETHIKQIFTPQEAALLIGLLVGGRGAFDQEFRDALGASGTAHLVALSGYNIALVAQFIASLFLLFGVHAKRWRFALTMLLIALFVIMTGAESSVVRAAFMGGILLLGNYIERRYSMRNAITLVATGMLIANPKLLLFDIGFQLSFLALLGIVYIQPIVRNRLHIEGDPGFFEWKKNLSATIAAQIAVLPILVATFGKISWIGILTNVAILGVVPQIMFWGFVTVLISFWSGAIAWIIAVPVGVLLEYVIHIIQWSATIGYIPTTFDMNIFWIFGYYALLGYGIYYWNSRQILTA